VTRDRVTSLVPCLESYWDNCRRHGRAVQFVVTDDAPGTEVQDQTRAALRLFENRARAQIRYAGWRERSRFAEALARESAVSVEIFRFALFGDDRCTVSTGANRNSLLLDTVGRRVRVTPAVAPPTVSRCRKNELAVRLTHRSIRRISHGGLSSRRLRRYVNGGGPNPTRRLRSVLARIRRCGDPWKRLLQSRARFNLSQYVSS
jgi:hypothetical protein